MMHCIRSSVYTLLITALLPALATAQFAPKPYELSGYVTAAPMYWKPPSFLDFRVDTQFLARQNFRWYVNSNLTAAVDLKEDLFLGPSARTLQQTGDVYAFRDRFLDLDHTLVDEETVAGSIEIDRLWLRAYVGDIEFTAGRQRIAWGTALVWNPTDLFNPTSPLDFSNIEKPGTDAFRAQYYWGPVSKLDIGVEFHNNVEDMVAAAKVTLNRWEYDFDFFAGHREGETVFGGGWAGNIFGGGFRGEVLAVHPDGSGDSLGVHAALSGDYTFTNTTYLHTELLYNSRGTTGNAGGLELLRSFQNGWLTPARLSIFGEVAKQLHPLVRGSVAGILNPYDSSCYAGPSVEWSALANLSVNVAGYLFGGENGTEFGGNGTLLLTRVQYSW